MILNNGIKRSTLYETISKGEKGFDAIQIVFIKPAEVDRLVVSNFTGNRPENCGNVDNPRVHPEITTPQFEVYTWKNHEWTTVNIKNLSATKSALSEQININFEKITAGRLKIVPVGTLYPYEHLYVNEIELFSDHNSLSDSVRFYLTSAKIPQNL